MTKTFTVVSNGNDGYGVRCDQDGCLENEEPFPTERQAVNFWMELTQAWEE